MNKTFLIAAMMVVFSFQFVARVAKAGEFREQAMCTTAKSNASFPRISLQIDPGSNARGILILYANDGWTQVYSGPILENSKALSFIEDAKVVTAIFDKIGYRAKISFNGDEYSCDERSFGN
jgi:hypothetical protein